MPAGASARRTAAVSALALTMTIALTAQPAAAADPRRVAVTLSRVTPTSFNQPTAVTHAGDGRLFVAEKRGYIRVVSGGRTQATPYLDLRRIVGQFDGEQGLLGLAFAPNFAVTRYLYVAYTNTDGSLQVTRFRAATTTATTVNFATRVPILNIAHPDASNHNGGMLAFGPDGMLYISTGDGGSTPQKAQDVGSLLGKILRIDVSRACAPLRYCIPAGNPFATTARARKEIWHFGLRNPWRFSFDRVVGSMWIADVGQGTSEEIDTIGKGIGGRNFGWPCREGTRTYGGTCRRGTLTGPVAELSHDDGSCAVTGGYVYRGRLNPVLAGTYVFTDFCTGTMWGVGRLSNGTWVRSQMGAYSGSISAFGESVSGELYAVDLSSGALLLVRAGAR
ncbi:MAG: PQQ-dependent sugar dehydrogenase [Mycobacteriales bacterium]